jgi:hypothetical protein
MFVASSPDGRARPQRIAFHLGSGDELGDVKTMS